MLDLEPIKRRLSEATPGPWRWQTEGHQQIGGHPYGYLETDDRQILKAHSDEEYIAGTAADADLIANCPTDLAALVEEVERLQRRDDDARRYWMLLERREEQLGQAEAEVERLKAVLVNLRDYGLRCDLNPTQPAGGWGYEEWQSYLKRGDDYVRMIARAALAER